MVDTWRLKAAAITLVTLAGAALVGGIVAAAAGSPAWTAACGAWFGGTATASAFGVAFLVQRRDRLDAKGQEDRDRLVARQREERLEDERHLEAELVRPDAGFGGHQGQVVTNANVTVTNNTDQPIFDVVIRVGYSSPARGLGDIGPHEHASQFVPDLDEPWNKDGTAPLTVDFTLRNRRWTKLRNGPAMPGMQLEGGYQQRWAHPDHVDPTWIEELRAGM